MPGLTSEVPNSGQNRPFVNVLSWPASRRRRERRDDGPPRDRIPLAHRLMGSWRAIRSILLIRFRLPKSFARQFMYWAHFDRRHEPGMLFSGE